MDTALIIQLFVLINPLSSLPFVVAAYNNKINVRRLAVNAVMTAYLIAIGIALIGPFLFGVFGITLDSFRIAGGIILLLLAIDTIRASDEDKQFQESQGIESLVAILATPLLTGPATISFITIKAYEMKTVPLLLDISAAFLFVGAVFIVISYAISKINTKLIDIVSKVLGLFLTAMAIEMIAKGIEGFIAASKHG
jgi:multiple antibiotic resistance protein